MLSSFEGRLLDRHLRGCASCRAFADSAAALTGLMRSASLEEPSRRVELPAAPARRVPRRAAGAFATMGIAAVAAFALFVPSSQNGSNVAAARAKAASGPMIVAVPGQPNPAEANIEVPRLTVRPVSVADEPIHGRYDEPA